MTTLNKTEKLTTISLTILVCLKKRVSVRYKTYMLHNVIYVSSTYVFINVHHHHHTNKKPAFSTRVFSILTGGKLVSVSRKKQASFKLHEYQISLIVN